MTKEGIYNSALDGITSVIEEVSDSIANEFKKTRPFDQQPVSNEELIYNYSQIPPDMRISLRQSLPGFEDYELKMEALIAKRARRVENAR